VTNRTGPVGPAYGVVTAAQIDCDVRGAAHGGRFHFPAASASRRRTI